MDATNRYPLPMEVPKVTFLEAIQWEIEAWREDIKETTILSCFRKRSVKVYEPSHIEGVRCSGLVRIGWNDEDEGEVYGPECEYPEYRITGPEFAEAESSVEQMLSELHRADCIRDMMKMSEFSNPIDEVVEYSMDDTEVCYSLLRNFGSTLISS